MKYILINTTYDMAICLIGNRYQYYIGTHLQQDSTKLPDVLHTYMNDLYHKSAPPTKEIT